MAVHEVLLLLFTNKEETYADAPQHNAKITARITDLDNRRSELTTRESKQLQQFTKTLEECQEVLSQEYYHKRGTLAPVPYN